MDEFQIPYLEAAKNWQENIKPPIFTSGQLIKISAAELP